MDQWLAAERQSFARRVADVLADHLEMIVPDPVLDMSALRHLTEGRTPIEAAILICHAQNQLVAESWVEHCLKASELAEMVIADRIYESRKLLNRRGRELAELLPDLPDFVRQTCFSDDFRHMIANTVSWDDLIESRMNSPDRSA